MQSFDPVWEEKYASGHEQRYPWDLAVSFVFRNLPAGRPRSQISFLEVGCGTGANLRFAAAEGLKVMGIDGSKAAIEKARRRFSEQGLDGDLQVGDFTSLPFADECCDLALDRGALCCSGTTGMKQALSEIARCLKPGGRLLFNPLADSHSSCRSGRQIDDDLVVDITEGTLVGAGQIRFVARQDIDALLPPTLVPLRIERKEIMDMTWAAGEVHAEWIVLAEKASA